MLLPLLYCSGGRTSDAIACFFFVHSFHLSFWQRYASFVDFADVAGARNQRTLSDQMKNNEEKNTMRENQRGKKVHQNKLK